jgi:hypothetical protein
MRISYLIDPAGGTADQEPGCAVADSLLRGESTVSRRLILAGTKRRRLAARRMSIEKLSNHDGSGLGPTQSAGKRPSRFAPAQAKFTLGQTRLVRTTWGVTASAARNTRCDPALPRHAKQPHASRASCGLLSRVVALQDYAPRPFLGWHMRPRDGADPIGSIYNSLLSSDAGTYPSYILPLELHAQMEICRTTD